MALKCPKPKQALHIAPFLSVAQLGTWNDTQLIPTVEAIRRAVSCIIENAAPSTDVDDMDQTLADAQFFLGAPHPDLPSGRLPEDTPTISWDLSTPGIFRANAVAPGDTFAPIDAFYLVSQDNPTLTNDRVVANTSDVNWDFATPGAATARLGARGPLSVIGRALNSVGFPADIDAAAASNHVLRESGGVLDFGTIGTGSLTPGAVDWEYTLSQDRQCGPYNALINAGQYIERAGTAATVPATGTDRYRTDIRLTSRNNADTLDRSVLAYLRSTDVIGLGSLGADGALGMALSAQNTLTIGTTSGSGHNIDISAGDALTVDCGGILTLGHAVNTDSTTIQSASYVHVGPFLRMIEQAASTPSLSATQGLWWVRNDTPNVPMFTDDTNVDHVLAYGGGVSGTPFLGWPDVLQNNPSSGAFNASIASGQRLEFAGAATLPAQGQIRIARSDFLVRARNVANLQDVELLNFGSNTLAIGDSVQLTTLGLQSATNLNLTSDSISATADVGLMSLSAGTDMTLSAGDDLSITATDVLALQGGGVVTIFGDGGTTQLLAYNTGANQLDIGEAADVTTLFLTAATTISASATTINVGGVVTTLVNISPSGAGADVEIAPADQARLYPSGQLLLGHATNTDSMSGLCAGAISFTAGSNAALTLSTQGTGNFVVVSNNAIDMSSVNDLFIYSTNTGGGGQVWLGNGTSTSLAATPLTEDIVGKCTDDCYWLPEDVLFLGMSTSTTRVSTSIYIGSTGVTNVLPAGDLNLGDSGTDHINHNAAGYALDIQDGALAFSSATIVTSTATGTQEVLAAATETICIIRWNGASAMNLDGMTVPTAGRGQFIFFYNVSAAQNVTVRHNQSTTAAAGILICGQDSRTVGPDCSMAFWYDHTSARWRNFA